jgi:hypothetical protein
VVPSVFGLGFRFFFFVVESVTFDKMTSALGPDMYFAAKYACMDDI